jgi:hypothetical protein
MKNPVKNAFFLHMGTLGYTGTCGEKITPFGAISLDYIKLDVGHGYQRRLYADSHLGIVSKVVDSYGRVQSFAHWRNEELRFIMTV